MGNRTIGSEEDHTKLVEAMAKKLEQEGMFVQADHIGHRNGRPNVIGGHIPDVQGTSSDNRIVAEAETVRTISLDETKSQFLAFSSGVSEFHVIVPKGYIPYMKQYVQMWNVNVDQYWEMEV
ncbi:hypothetical protein GOV14_04460 [Candidatus Pacearchaeota archaeon]|nr:hypothetical protein [Candidatus Pacearchaeota archaeon]